MNAKRILPVLATSVLFAAAAGGCGRKVDGTYGDANGMMSVTLGTDGKAAVSNMGIGQSDLPYTVNGNKVTVRAPGGDIPFTIADDGSLTVPEANVVLKKKG